MASGYNGLYAPTVSRPTPQSSPVLMDLEDYVGKYLTEAPPRSGSGVYTNKVDWSNISIAMSAEADYKLKATENKGSVSSASRRLNNNTSSEQEFNLGEVSTHR